jgi:hypothetical protein
VTTDLYTELRDGSTIEVRERADGWAWEVRIEWDNNAVVAWGVSVTRDRAIAEARRWA